MEYFQWHFTYVPRELIRIGRNFAIFFFHFFSVGDLAHTLFSPWKGLHQTARGTKSTVFDRITFNIISRLVGAVVRSATITVGLISVVFVIIGWVPIVILWLVLPFVTYPIYVMTGGKRRGKSATGPVIIKQQINAKKYIAQILASDYGKHFTSRLMLNPEEVINSIEKSTTTTPTDPPHPQLVPESRSLQHYFATKKLTPTDLTHVSQWYERDHESVERVKAFWELENLLRVPSIGKNWLYGYTPTLDTYTTEVSYEGIPIHSFVGRKKEIEHIEQILSRRGESNVFVIGEPGVGAHTLIAHLAQLITEGRVYPQLESKRLLKLDLERVFTTGNSAQQKAQLTTLLDEARSAGNIVLVIDQFDRFVTSRQDRIDMTDVFVHAIADTRLQLIALLTPTAFEQFVRPNKTLSELFEIVEVHEPTPTQALLILEGVLSQYEKGNVLFSYQSLKELVHLADRYVKTVPFPEKALDILDAAATQKHNSLTKKNQYAVVTAQDIQVLLSKRTKTPVTVAAKEKETLLHLEEHLHKRVINQSNAISAVSNALRRARTDVSVRKNKPFGTFLFLGPTGVGKTETAKALAASFFGSERHMARFDMSEFHEEQGLRRLIGDFTTKTQGVFATRLREDPYTLVLLDEFEKADPKVRNLFLTGFDEGYITDAFGKKIYLTTTLIIATSNAGSEFIRQRVSEKVSGKPLQTELVDYVQRKRIFTPELLNRFDEVVVFEPLTRKNTEKILDLFIAKLNAKVKAEHGFTIQLHDATREKVLKDGFSASFGGRALARAIQKHVENPLSHRILSGETSRGNNIQI